MRNGLQARRPLVGGRLGWRFCALLCAFGCFAGAQAAAAFTIPEAQAAPVLDGDLSDEAWAGAAEVREFQIVPTGEKVAQRALLMADGAWLFVGMEIAHPLPREIQPNILDPASGMSVVRDDSVEVFFDPGTDGQLYYQFAVNAANVGTARRNVLGGFEPVPADPGRIPWRHAVRMTERGWNVELAIPLTLLGAYGDLGAARMNLNINRNIPTQTVEGVTSGHDRQFSSWAHLVRNYHEPERFIPVRGLDRRAIEVPFLPLLNQVEVSDYSIVANEYTLAFDVQNAFATPGAAEVVVRDMPVDGEPVELREPLPLAGEERRSLALQVPVGTPGARRMEVALLDAASGEVMQSRTLTEEQTAALELLEAYLDRSYYTDETEARAIAVVRAAPADRPHLRIRVLNEDGEALGEAPAAGESVPVPVPLGNLPVGRHDVTVELHTAGGATVAGQRLTLEKKAPRPGLEWKIDHENRVLLNNGEPFFPFGICANIEPDAEKDWRDLGRAFNMVLDWNRRRGDAYADIEGYVAYAEAAARHGLLCMPWIRSAFESMSRADRRADRVGTFDAVTQRQVERMRELAPTTVKIVEALKELGNVPGYFIWDEPNYLHFDMSAEGRVLREIVDGADGYRPTFVNYAAHIPEGDKYTDWFDVLMTDPYWIPAGRAHIATPNWVSRRTHAIDQLAKPARFRQPVMVVPVAAHWSGTRKRPLLPQEQRVQTYLAIIHGAKGIVYWFYPVFHQASYEIFAELGQEMERLGPAIVAPDVPQRIIYTPQEFDPLINSYPAVQAALHRDPAGGYVLLAANSLPFPADATYRLPGLQDGEEIRRLFGPETYRVEAGAFSDRLEGYATRAYALAGSEDWETSTPLEIAVESHGDRRGFRPEPSGYPPSGRPGRRNLIPNSSFEDCSLPDWPDYFKVFVHRNPSPSTRLGTGYSVLRIDRENPYHGEQSLAIHYTGHARDGVEFWLAPQEPHPREYTFSAYMRASRDGARARLLGAAGWRQAFELTTEWERYHFTGTVEPDWDHRHHFRIRAEGEPGDIVWLDALQLERGTEPTEYEP